MKEETLFSQYLPNVSLSHNGSSPFNHHDSVPEVSSMNPAVKALIPFIFLIGITGIAGNILLLCVMRRSKTVHRTYGLSLSLLGLTDSLNILMILLQLVNDSLHQFGFNHLLYRDTASCKVWDFITYFAIFTSAWLVVCITCERLLVIYFPLRGRICCRSYYAAVLGLVLCLSAGTQLPRLWLSEYDPKFNTCELQLQDGRLGVFFAISYHSYLRFIFFYGLPCLIIFVCNILIILKMHGFTRRSAVKRMVEYQQRYGRSMFSSNGDTRVTSPSANPEGEEPYSRTENLTSTSPPMCSFTISRSAHRDRLRATQILVVISCTYLICFAPETISELYFTVNLPSWMRNVEKTSFDFFAQFDHLWRFVFQMFTVISYGSNFYTYLLFGKRFRREISSLLPGTSSIVRHQNHVLYHQQQNVRQTHRVQLKPTQRQKQTVGSAERLDAEQERQQRYPMLPINVGLPPPHSL